MINILKSSEEKLKVAGIESARLDAEVLLSYVLGISRADLYLQRSNYKIDKATLNKFEILIRKRAEHCPVAYLTGKKEFWSLSLQVTPDVLIPRPETELIVECALRFMKSKHETCNCDCSILDLCTGSGCIAAALATELTNAQITVVDISPAAIEVARKNLAFAGSRIKFITGNLFEHLANEAFDIITANPPYIPSPDMQYLAHDILKYEPLSALDGGKSGLDLASKIIKNTKHHLLKNGYLIMEMGEGQAGALTQLGHKAGFEKIAQYKDLAGIERVISFQK